MPELKLDLGSGPRPAEGFEGVDVIEGITHHTFDFNSGRPWPFADDSVSELRSSHLIEHIDARNAMVWERVAVPTGNRPYFEQFGQIWQATNRVKDLLVHFFEEAYRVARPDAYFEVRCPNAFHVHAWGDPTHRRGISADLVHYLSREGREARGVEFYGHACNWVGTVAMPVVPPVGLEPGTPAFAAWERVMTERLECEVNVGAELLFRLHAVKP